MYRCGINSEIESELRIKNQLLEKTKKAWKNSEIQKTRYINILRNHTRKNSFSFLHKTRGITNK